MSSSASPPRSRKNCEDIASKQDQQDRNAQQAPATPRVSPERQHRACDARHRSKPEPQREHPLYADCGASNRKIEKKAKNAPSRFSVFQSKAQNLTESTVKAEVIAKSHRAKHKRAKASRPKLNDAVLQALSRRGSYVVPEHFP
jgi:hypothetical protein